MASHKVGSIPGGRLGDAERPNAAQSIVTGSYGLSVRVQGIDGQPFVVLNKQSAECLNHGEPTGNGVPNSSFLDSYDEYDFRGLGGASHTDDPFAEYRSQKQMQKTLLNFQMYPELLMPYDPENNTLSLERCHAPRRRPASLAEATSPLLPRTRSPGSPDAAAHLDEDRLQPSPAREVSRTFPTRSLSTASSSSSSSLERGRHEPDVLPLRRHGSSGPVLQLPPSCGTTRPPCTYLQEALYADTINRHENRRYIPFLPGTGRDIDTGSIPSVDELISKFDSRDGQQRRGRAGRRNRIGAEERKRSRSVDSALPFGPRGKADWPDRVSKISSGECRLLPSESKHRNGVPPSDPENSETPRSPVSVRGNVGTGASSQDSSGSTSPQGSVSVAKTSLLSSRKLLSKSSTTLAEVGGGDGETSSRTVKVLTSMATTSLSKAPVENHKKTSAERNVQVTPDLLKGQQELSQQTNEETAKQILFNYLKDGSSDNDDTTKRKVNLVFEKIQTLKSRAARNTQVRLSCSSGGLLCVFLSCDCCALQKLVAMVAAQDKAAADRENMQTELAKSQQESAELREQLSRAEEELRKTTEELRQVKTERDQSQTEVKDLQEQLSEMHDELDGAKRAVIDSGVKDAMLEDLLLMKLDFQEVLQSKEDQDEVLRRRERELIALKGALKEEVATHDKEVDTLRARYEQEVHKLQVALQERNATTSQEKAAVEAARAEVEARAEHLVQEGERLRKRERELENAIAELNRVIDEAKLKESLLGDRVTRLEKEKEQLEESIVEAKGQEEELTRANTALTTQLEDIQKDLTKVTQQHKELSDQLREERIQKEQLKKAKNQVDDERQFLSRTVEKLRKEMCHLAEASQTATSELQAQMDEQQERKRREFAELQRQLRDKAAELEQSREALDRLQEKLSRLEEDLRQCKEEREGAELRGQSLEQQVHDLELEMEAKSRSKEDRSRRIKLLEDRISQLELDLEEERSNGDLLMDRLERGKEQIEQIRNDLLQERAAKQELECDKMTLERQNKELKSRVARLECSQESSKGSMVSQLEDRIQELEEKLQGESRDRANLQLANRRLERKVKEMMIHVDDEHKSLQDQKDQLNLRLKTLKRQMDEAEEEIERLEHGKKKLQRDLEEQMEQNEELQSQIKALRNEMRRKSTSAPILNDDLDDDDDDDDDDMSTDGDTYYHSASGNK
uniref:Cingulin like 1 n=1 Tax=Scleropages formosus TaxID=113540 RepID=A0A8C9TLS1_SCLFO